MSAEVKAAIDSLSSLQDGWREGRGVAPSRRNLDWLIEKVAKTFPASLSHPSVTPTEEGNVILEWISPDSRIELEVNFKEQNLELYATDLTSDRFVEHSFGPGRWKEAFSKVATLLESWKWRADE